MTQSTQPEFPRLRRVTETIADAPLVVYFDVNGDEIGLSVPADWATQEAAGTPYVLGIVAGLPAWVVTAASAVDGFGAGFGDAFGQD